MSMYNGFSVYKKNKDGKLIYVELPDDVVNWLNAKNELASIWSPANASYTWNDYKIVVFDKDYDGKSGKEIFANDDYSEAVLVYKDLNLFINQVKNNIAEAQTDIDDGYSRTTRRLKNLTTTRQRWIESLNTVKNRDAVDTIIEKIDDLDENINETTNDLQDWYKDNNEINDYPLIKAYEKMLQALENYAADPNYVVVPYYQN